MANFTSMTTYDFYFIAVVSVMAGFAIGVRRYEDKISAVNANSIEKPSAY